MFICCQFPQQISPRNFPNAGEVEFFLLMFHSIPYSFVLLKLCWHMQMKTTHKAHAYCACWRFVIVPVRNEKRCTAPQKRFRIAVQRIYIWNAAVGKLSHSWCSAAAGCKIALQQFEALDIKVQLFCSYRDGCELAARRRDSMKSAWTCQREVICGDGWMASIWVARKQITYKFCFSLQLTNLPLLQLIILLRFIVDLVITFIHVCSSWGNITANEKPQTRLFTFDVANYLNSLGQHRIHLK